MARLALHRAEEFSQDNANPIKVVEIQMRLWRKIGDEANVRQLEARYSLSHQSTEMDRLVTQSFFQSGYMSPIATPCEEIQIGINNLSTIFWIPSATTRVLTLTMFAGVQFPLELVHLSPLP